MIKRVLLVCLVIASTHVVASAQLRTGVKAGLSIQNLSAGEQTILDSLGAPEYTMAVLKSKVGVHIGFFVQANFGKHFFIQPELVFNSQTVKYLFTTIEEPTREIIREENYQSIDIPLIVGFRIGQVRFGVGPEAHLFLNVNTEIDNAIEDEEFLDQKYTPEFQTLTWGWQVGIGIDIWQLHLDARYEGNIEEFGNHMNFYGRKYSFGVTPGRILASVGISF
jgi:hypothetical protein